MGISRAVARTWKEATELGYDAYKKKLISAGMYRDRVEDSYSEKVKGRRRAAQNDGD